MQGQSQTIRRLKDEKTVVEAFIKWLGVQKPSSASLSNNMSENSIRPVVVGRKNWLFSDTMDGAEAKHGNLYNCRDGQAPRPGTV